MDAIGGLMAVTRYCRECGQHQTVNYWRHSDTYGHPKGPAIRYQCNGCGTQTADLQEMDVSAEEYVAVMTSCVLTDMSLGDYLMRFGDSPVRTRDGEHTTVAKALGAAWSEGHA